MNSTHGCYGTPTHRSWHSMISRCRYQGMNGYENYGGRGITVCERWLKFENFLADMGERPAGMTLERINRNGNYETANCKWDTMANQRRNSSQNRIISFGGISQCLADWASALRLTPQSLSKRLKKWPIERALTETSRGY